MAIRSNLRAAQQNKKDEFYTAYDDIKNELIHYAKHFKGKTIYCNCDDHAGIGLGTPNSNFLKFLADNFQAFGLKKVIATHYEPGKKSKMYVLHKDNTGDGIICNEDIEEIPLKSDGDFRSDECVELLKQADIVITNPPFSLFREYISQIMKYKKKFLIIGHQNAITYKEFFPLIKENKLWLGYGFKGGAGFFINKFYTDYATATSRKEGHIRVSGVNWFTNLDHKKRHELLNTGKVYLKYETMYPKYENYDAINVDKTNDVPMDYSGVMGVPITFLDKWNPDQFDIIGLGISNSGLACGVKPYKPKHKKYRKEVQKRGAVDGDLYMMIGNEVVVPYARILIRKKKGN